MRSPSSDAPMNRWRNTSACGSGSSGRSRIFRVPPRKNPAPARFSKLCGDNSVTVQSAGTSASPLAEMIRKVSGRVPGHLSPEAKLDEDLNLSSLDRVELLSALEDRYQLDLSETRFASANTVGDVEKMLQGKMPGRARFHYPRWAQRWPVTWIRLAAHYLLLRPAVFLLGWPRVEGRENLRGVARPGAGDLQSHQRCGCGVREDRVAVSLAPPAGGGHGRRGSGKSCAPLQPREGFSAEPTTG